MAEYSDIPQGFAVKQQFSDVPQGFSVATEAPPKTQTEATMRRLGFVGPMPQLGAKDYAIGAGDLVVSGLRSIVNKPATTLAGLVGAVNPNDTYIAARDREREKIASDRYLVKDERLRTPQGQTLASIMGILPKTREQLALSVPGEFGEMVGGEPLRDVAESAMILGGLRAPRFATEVPPPRLRTAADVAARYAPRDSAGAAAAAVDVGGITPELNQAVVAAGRRGRGISNDALARHVEADTLPVPVRLTRGEATQDPVVLSQEKNLRGKHPEMAARMDESNKALGANLEAVRNEVGQNVFSTNHVEHGDTIIAAYKARDAAAQAKIGDLYKRLRDANGGDFPVDARSLLNTVGDRLHQALLLDHAPKAVMATLRRLAAKDGMTFENFESLRTNLARIQRSATTDGNEVAAAGIIRNAMEELPLRTIEARGDPLAAFGAGNAEAQKLVNQQYRFTLLKRIADEARAAARQRFQALEADPAYKAAVNDTVPPDRFVQRFILGAPRDELAVMARFFENDPVVRETISVAALDHLRDAARLDQRYAGNFSADGFARALRALDPKANLIFDARTAETLGKLSNVARYTTAQPRGSFVNNSNTLVAAGASRVADIAEGMTNVGFQGVPVGTFLRRSANYLKTQRTIKRALQPGAGIETRNALAPNAPPRRP